MCLWKVHLKLDQILWIENDIFFFAGWNLLMDVDRFYKWVLSTKLVDWNKSFSFFNEFSLSWVNSVEYVFEHLRHFWRFIYRIPIESKVLLSYSLNIWWSNMNNRPSFSIHIRMCLQCSMYDRRRCFFS